MYDTTAELSDKLKDHHALAWQQIASAGDFFTGAQRIAMVHAAREALMSAMWEPKNCPQSQQRQRRARRYQRP